MNGLGLVKAEASALAASTELKPATQLSFEDTLACGARLWIRGRILKSLEVSSGSSKSRWWRRTSNDVPAAPPTTIQLETKVGRGEVSVPATVGNDGRFEARLTMALPPARRGWRVARHTVSMAGQSPEACSVVLLPSADSVAAIVVILPLDFTLPNLDTTPSPNASWVARLPEFVTSLQPASGQHCPVYYLAAVPEDETSRQAELGLAAAERGWPRGYLVTLPVGHEGAQAAFGEALERLRWLFAGTLDLLVLNLEPSVTSLPVELREPAQDWGVVRRFLSCEDLRQDPLARRHDGPRPTRAALLPRHPVVFCHGMLAFSMLKMQMPEDLNCFAPLRRFLIERGIRVLFPQVAPTAGVAERAASLKEQILCWTDEPIDLVAHSMGGLDARYMITHLGMEERVRCLTTVCTPHRGTYLADWFLANFRNRVPLLLALEAFGVNVKGFRDCRLEACRQFNATTPNSARVRYFSYGGEVSPGRLSPVLRRAWNILTPIEGPNDGMVSVGSARWGEYLGTVYADHFAQTPDSLFLRAGEDFDPVGFYSRMIEDLARRGF
jgi:triacylglycerol lipase